MQCLHQRSSSALRVCDGPCSSNGAQGHCGIRLLTDLQFSRKRVNVVTNTPGELQIYVYMLGGGYGVYYQPIKFQEVWAVSYL